MSGVADVTGMHAACTAYIASDSAAAGFTVSLTMATAAANQRHLLHRSPRAFVRLSVARKPPSRWYRRRAAAVWNEMKDKPVERSNIGGSGVATGWTGLDMSTPLLLEVAAEIDTNPTSFYRGRGREGRSGPRWGLRLRTPVIGWRCALAMSVHPMHIF